MHSNTSPAYRSTRSLDGPWLFRTDPDDCGDEGWYEPDAPWTDARTVSVPHCWQEDDVDSGVETAWYRRTVTFDPDENDRAFLRFGAVDYEATVSVNGTDVATHRDGYLPFEVEVTDSVVDGENAIVVRVHDPLDLSEIPHGKQGEPWYTRVSGIWQSVTLESRPRTFVETVRATPNLDDDSVAFAVETDGPATDDLSAEIVLARDGEVVLEEDCDLVDGNGTCTAFLADPAYWTPDQPNLYDFEVRLRRDGAVLDSYGDYFGMRSIDADGDRLLLNGDPLYVRGALDQAYYPETLYRPFDDDLFEREIRLAKELGFNLLRKHIKPAHPDFVEAADRLGMLVWEEPANPTRYTERSKREVRDQLRGLIERDYNSPSVVVWSIYNEEWGIGLDQDDFSDHPGRLDNDEEKQDYLTDLYHEAKARDPTRLVCDNSGWAHVATDVNDYHRYFVSPDRAAAWEADLDEIVDAPEDNYAATETDPADAPIVVSEFGTWGFPDLDALRERYGGDPPWFSHDFLDAPLKRPDGVDSRYEATNLPEVFEGYGDLAAAWQARQSASLEHVVEAMRVRDGIAGYVVTEFSDIEWEFNGVLDYWREPKAFADEFAAVNDELLVVVEPDAHVLAVGQEITGDVHVVNDTGDPLEGTLRLDGFCEEERRSICVAGFGTTTLEDALTVSAPAEASTGLRQVEVTFETDDRTVSNAEVLAVVRPEGVGDRTVFADEPLASRLADSGVAVADALYDADVAIVHSLDEEIESFVEAGNAAVLVPAEDGRMADDSAFAYRNLPATESWNLVASMLYRSSDLVDDLCPDARVGWAFEDVFPYDLATDLSADDEVHVGSVEGWLANWSSPLVVRTVGDGLLCCCTFRVTDAYGEHPTATLLVNRLVGAL